MKKGRNLPILVTFEIMNKEKRKEAMFQKGSNVPERSFPVPVTLSSKLIRD